MKRIIKNIFSSQNLHCVGFTDMGPYHELLPRLSSRQPYCTGFEERDLIKRITPSLLMENGQSIIVVLFPYFVDHTNHANLSNYCYSKDYHLLIKEQLDAIGAQIKNIMPDFEFQSYADNGPLVDRYLAYRSGLGFFGTNGHLINDTYGTYTFIGYMITNLPLEPDFAQDKSCYQCGKCVDYCPGNAIDPKGHINGLNCRSFITQKKRDLSSTDEDVIRKGSLIFGCDVCQLHCPHNAHVPITPLQYFKEDLLFEVFKSDIEGLTNKSFRAHYGDRAFSWRGKKLLLRNMDLINK